MLLGFAACGEYQAILKSKDPELKYQKALSYFNDKQYVKAQTLLDEITTYYRGTDRSQDVLIYLSRSYMGQKDYSSAAEYYQAYIRNYPKGRYIVEAQFGHKDSSTIRPSPLLTNVLKNNISCWQLSHIITSLHTTYSI